MIPTFGGCVSEVEQPEGTLFLEDFENLDCTGFDKVCATFLEFSPFSFLSLHLS